MNDPSIQCPKSASNSFINHITYLGALSLLVLLVFKQPDFIKQHPIIFILFYIVPIAVYEIFDWRVFLREGAGLASRPLHPFCLKRLFFKYLGLALTFGAIALLYWMFPEYHKDEYKPFFENIEKYYLWLIVPIIIYMAIVDRFMKDPYDSFWHCGRLLIGKDWNQTKLTAHFKSWTVRAYFLPIMFGYLMGNLVAIVNFNYFDPHAYKEYYDIFFTMLVSADLVSIVVGYALAARIFENNIQSTDPFLKGWVVCLICYPPLWNILMYGSYLGYANGPDWYFWVKDSPTLTYIWSAAIIILMGLYSSASLSFGLRFSNLTYRGVITSWTYKITKHPAYVFKNLWMWVSVMPFMVAENSTWQNSLKYCLMLLCINFIYFLRAKAEERHLSYYPEYRQYAQWIEKHGWFRAIDKVLPRLKFKPDKLYLENISDV